VRLNPLNPSDTPCNTYNVIFYSVTTVMEGFI